jgi:hypothetical protein
MKTELIKQYGHTWRVFERIVGNFDDVAWIRAGRGSCTPARLAFHILKATKYYLQESDATPFASGKSFEADWITAHDEDLPFRSDIQAAIAGWQAKTASWLSAMDLDAANTAFDWAGRNRFGVALFLLRHSLYHLGELSSILNESRNGNVEDIYVKAL